MLDFPKKIVVAKNKRKFKKEYLWGYLFIASPIVGFLLFAFLPMLFSIYVSFTEFDLYSPARFNGLENYKQLFQDDIFIKTVGNTFYAALGIPIG